MTKEILGLITIAMAVAVYLPYLINTIRGKLTPHPFSWIIWLLLIIISYLAQISDNAGPGAWMNAATIVICVGIIFFSIKNGFKDITRFDIAVFSGGLIAIPLWVMMKDPTWSVILVSILNSIAYIPTFRKSWHNPYGESVYTYGVNIIRHGLAIFALSNVSLITALFPIVLVLDNLALTVFLIWRRTKLRDIEAE